MLGVAVAGLVTWPLTGHPSTAPLPAAIVAADVVHIAAMSVWLGGLATLTVFLLRGTHPRVLGVILPAWSRWAALSVVWLIAGGTVQAVVRGRHARRALAHRVRQAADRQDRDPGRDAAGGRLRPAAGPPGPGAGRRGPPDALDGRRRGARRPAW